MSHASQRHHATPDPSSAPGAAVAATTTLEFATAAAPQFIDITDDVCAAVAASGVRNGLVTVFAQHTTAAVCINEREPLLMRDIARLLRALAPENSHYDHNDFTVRTVNMTDDECRNGHAHLRQLLLGGGVTTPIVDGAPALGVYQRIFLIELDHPRPRRVLVSAVGVR
ncbi:MAG: secondary thiamine-phosphate synthase enzyme YjbQ [Dehalococcoidia bacterium]